MKLDLAAVGIRQECALMLAAATSPSCIASKVALMLGLAYWVGPLDLIPASTPYFGHVDEAACLIGSVALARFLIPASLPTPGAASPGVTAPGPGRLPGLTADLTTFWLVQRRHIQRANLRARRLVARDTADAARADTRPGNGLAARLFGLLGYRLWWRLRAPFGGPASHTSPIVIGGAARSGTTLLRTMLGRHPAIVSGPETTVFLHRISSPADIGERMGWPAADIARWQFESRSQTEFIERFQAEALARSGKTVWAEKTPHNAGRFGFIRGAFPRARIVHIVRDGRDTVCSLRRKPFAKLDDAAWNSLAAARRCAVQWRNSVRPGLRMRGDALYHELHYEDLVTHPEATLRRLLAFLGLPWDHAMLVAQRDAAADPDELLAASAVFDSSIGRWRQDLSADEQAAVRRIIGPVLADVGYGWEG